MKLTINQFIQKTNLKIEVIFIKKDFYFYDDKSKRNIYIITLIKGDKIRSFNFGDSIFNTTSNKQPTKEDVLESILNEFNLETTSFKDFCLNYGYEDITKYKQIRSIYKELKENKKKIESLFTKEELNLLQFMEF